MTAPAPDRLAPELLRALTRAAEDARGRGHVHLGTGHLLMGVLGVPYSPGAKMLGGLGVLLHDVDAEIVRVAGYGRRTAEDGEVPDGERSGSAAVSVSAAVTAAADEDVVGPSDAPRRRWFRHRAPLPTSGAASAALRHAGEVADAAVGTEHLVLGLLASADGLARRILTGRGVTTDRVREALPGG